MFVMNNDKPYGYIMELYSRNDLLDDYEDYIDDLYEEADYQLDRMRTNEMKSVSSGTCIIDQDKSTRDMLEDLKVSYENIRRMLEE